MKYSLPAASWHEYVLSQFTQQIADVCRITVVSDPDNIFAERELLENLDSSGFEVVFFSDPVMFRFIYESRFRAVDSSCRVKCLVLISKLSRDEIGRLPFDVLDAAKRESRVLCFSIAELFPGLVPQIVMQLDRADLPELYEALKQNKPRELNEVQTKDYIIRHVFGIAPELVKTDVDLLRSLLQLHLSGRVLPGALSSHFLGILSQTRKWKEWPLDLLVLNRSDFFGFLNERWPLFVIGQSTGRLQREESELHDTVPLRFNGPRLLPFDHSEIHAYVSRLFAEGFLDTILVPEQLRSVNSWISVGLKATDDHDSPERLRRLLQLLETDLPSQKSNHQDWIRTAQRWAEAVFFMYKECDLLQQEDLNRITLIREHIEQRFLHWIVPNHSLLSSLACWPKPIMVHHIPRYLTQKMRMSKTHLQSMKIALLILDGLALDQWMILRSSFSSSFGFDLHEEAVFAWVPTLTSVSRPSLFSGCPPVSSRGGFVAQREETLWTRLWEEETELPKKQIGYSNQGEMDDTLFCEQIREKLSRSGLRVIGIVVSSVDRILHGTITGKAGLHTSIRYWSSMHYLKNLVLCLLDYGYDVHLSSDHGNTEAVGIGRPNIGSLALDKGERVLMFRDDRTRIEHANVLNASISWPSLGSEFPLLAANGEAFTTKNSRSVTHGGASIEEVIVPFVRIRRL